jgi:hypothetical protein
MSTAEGFTTRLNANIAPNSAVPNLHTLLLVDGNNSGGTPIGYQYIKGRNNIWRKSRLWPTHFLTLVDSTPQLTQSTSGYRPPLRASRRIGWM